MSRLSLNPTHHCFLFSGNRILPYAWQSGTPRAGLLDTEAAAWSHGRLASNACAEMNLPGWRMQLACSPGLRLIGEPMNVDAANGYDLYRLGGLTARDSLRAASPAELRGDPPLHRIVVVRQLDTPAIAILGAGTDGSLTLTDAVETGEQLCWAIRQPLATEQDMRQALSVAVDPKKCPNSRSCSPASGAAPSSTVATTATCWFSASSFPVCR